jgi:hypothetical protein
MGAILVVESHQALLKALLGLTRLRETTGAWKPCVHLLLLGM